MPSAEKALYPGRTSFVILEVASSFSAGSFNLRETFLGSINSNFITFGKGTKTSNVSMLASSPQDLKCLTTYSAFCLLQGEPT